MKYLNKNLNYKCVNNFKFKRKYTEYTKDLN